MNAVLALFFINFVLMVFRSLPEFTCHYTTCPHGGAMSFSTHLSANKFELIFMVKQIYNKVKSKELSVIWMNMGKYISIWKN